MEHIMEHIPEGLGTDWISNQKLCLPVLSGEYEVLASSSITEVPINRSSTEVLINHSKTKYEGFLERAASCHHGIVVHKAFLLAYPKFADNYYPVVFDLEQP